MQKCALFLQNNVPAHNMLDSANDFGSEYINHPLCPPDLDLSEYFLFPNLKVLNRRKFSNNSVVVEAKEQHFSDQICIYLFLLRVKGS